MRKNLRKTVATIAMTVMLSVTAVVGIGTSAKAANTADTPFSYNSANGSGTTEWRDKNNDTKVYVYPTSGPAIRYSVLGRKNGDSDTTYTICSNNVRIPQGVQGSITNHVYESGYRKAKLRLTREKHQKLDTTGVWSPDSTRNYTIFN